MATQLAILLHLSGQPPGTGLATVELKPGVHQRYPEAHKSVDDYPGEGAGNR